MEGSQLGQRMVRAVESICSSQITIKTMPSLVHVAAGDRQSVAIFEASEALAREHQDLELGHLDVFEFGL